MSRAGWVTLALFGLFLPDLILAIWATFFVSTRWDTIPWLVAGYLASLLVARRAGCAGRRR